MKGRGHCGGVKVGAGVVDLVGVVVVVCVVVLRGRMVETATAGSAG